MIRNVFNSIKKILLILTREQKLLAVVVLLGAVVAAVLETIGVSAIIPLVNVILRPQDLWNNQVVSVIAGKFKIETDTQLTFWVIVGVVITYFLKNAYFVFYTWVKVKYSNKVQRECSITMMKSYMNRGYNFFLTHNYSEVSQGVNGDVASVYNMILGLVNIFSQISVVISIFIFLVAQDWQIACGVIVTAIVCIVVVVLFFRKQMVEAGEKQRKYAIISNRIFVEAFQGIKEVYVLRKQKFFVKEYEENVIKRQNAQALQMIGTEIPSYIIETFCIIGIMAVLVVRINAVGNPESFVAVLAAFAVGAFRILPAIGKISVSINQFSAGKPGLDAVYENLLNARKNENMMTYLDKYDDEKFADISFTKCLRVDNVVFSYGEQYGNVLNGISVEIKRGTSVAFVGESGAGKSTLADIVLGLLEAKSGTVTLDGVGIERIPNRWSRTVGFVPQSIYLADVPIRENIAFGIKKEEISDKQIEKVLRQANLWDFINSLPQGIYSHVGDRGVRLSGGQRQRIGIARALYHDPEILVLDEATSALDNETEKSVMEAIDSLHGKITMVIIAHRLTTIKNCDYIYEIANGKAISRKYEDLL